MFRSLSYIAIASLFFIIGVGGGSWASRIAALPEALNVSHQTLGWVQLMAVVGSLIAFACSAKLLRQARQSTTTMLGIGVYCISLPLAGATINVFTTSFALLVMGLSSGFLAISMNLYAIRWEKKNDRPMLATCHGALSAGTLLGALLGQQADARGFSMVQHLTVVMAVTAVFSVIFLTRQFRTLDTKKAAEKDSDNDAKASNKKAPLSQSLIVVGIMVACAAICESTINGWGPLFLHAEYDLTTAQAASAFIVATLVTAVARLGVERAVTRFGARTIVVAGAVVLAVGAASVLFAASVNMALASIALVSVGTASIVPLGYREASLRRPDKTERALAIMTQWTYSGALVAPPVVGFISDRISLRVALACLGFIAGAIAWSSKSLKARAD